MAGLTTGLWKRWIALGVLLVGLIGFEGMRTAYAQGAGNTVTTAQKPSAAIPKNTGAVLDINTATVDQLKALPGIGDAYAKRIIDGRPYAAKNQLTQRGILPQATYDKIKDRIVAHRAAK